MGTRTFKLACPADQWTQIADGATYSNFGVQYGFDGAVDIAITGSLPADDFEDYVIVWEHGDKSFGTPLSSGDIVYGRGHNGKDSSVRGFRY